MVQAGCARKRARPMGEALWQIEQVAGLEGLRQVRFLTLDVCVLPWTADRRQHHRRSVDLPVLGAANLQDEGFLGVAVGGESCVARGGAVGVDTVGCTEGPREGLCQPMDDGLEVFDEMDGDCGPSRQVLCQEGRGHTGAGPQVSASPRARGVEESHPLGGKLAGALGSCPPLLEAEMGRLDCPARPESHRGDRPLTPVTELTLAVFAWRPAGTLCRGQPGERDAPKLSSTPCPWTQRTARRLPSNPCQSSATLPRIHAAALASMDRPTPGVSSA